jgi:NAD(P)-dependent dehydrogenase (short-subunit alcohol dehydrogenase family)
MTISALLDTAMDRTIALGYGNVGLAVRRRLPGWPADPPRMDGRVVLVTGAASGLGLAAATGFARLGASVRALARSGERGDQAANAVREAVPAGDVQPVACDLSDLAQLLRFTSDFAAREARLDVLVNNAGVMPDDRERSADGHELTFATNVLAPFALIAGLADLLKRSAPARVINVSSGGMYAQSLPVGDWESDHSEYGPQKFYARSKRELMVLTELWARRLQGSGVVVHAMHPGWADTGGVQTAMPVFRRVAGPILRTPEQGADTIVWLGGAAEALQTTGLLWQDRRPRPTHYLLGASAQSPEAGAELWRYCEAQLEAVQRGGSAV